MRIIAAISHQNCAKVSIPAQIQIQTHIHTHTNKHKCKMHIIAFSNTQYHQEIDEHLVECSHASHVYPVDVDVDAGPSQQRHDCHPVALLDALLEDHLVGEANPTLAGILPGEHTRPP